MRNEGHPILKSFPMKEVITISFHSNELKLYNISLLETNGEQFPEPDLDEETKTLKNKYISTLQSFFPLTYRSFIFQEVSLDSRTVVVTGAGGAIPVGKNLWLMLNHVTYNAKKITVCNKETAILKYVASYSPDLNGAIPIDYTYLDQFIRKDRDPISLKSEDFCPKDSPFDVTLWNGPDFGVYCYPDFPMVSEGDNLVTFSYPGVAGAALKALNYVYGDLPHPSEDRCYVIFNGFDKKSASFGKVLKVENNIFCSSCCLFGGSSGALIHKLGSKPCTFIGIHIGGDYAHCKNCLKIEPSKRNCPKHPEALTSCNDCRKNGCFDCQKNSQHVLEPFGYNFGYSVHHPAFVLLYAKYVLPSFGASIPIDIQLYLQAHKDLLEMNSEWLIQKK